ncbi:g11046 [Coccomyxa elongata]
MNSTGLYLLHGKSIGAFPKTFPSRCRRTLPLVPTDQTPEQSGVILRASAEGSVTQNKDNFRQLLQKAKDYTLRHPEGQLHGRRGRRCVLEDGERLLLLCLDIRPSCIEARNVLMQNLILQNRGRELEVPRLAVDTLKHTALRGCKQSSNHAYEAMNVVKLGLVALKKAERHSSSFQNYLEDVFNFVPDLREDICACALEEYSVREALIGAGPSGSMLDDLLVSHRELHRIEIVKILLRPRISPAVAKTWKN